MGLLLIFLFITLVIFSTMAISTFGFVTILVLVFAAPLTYAVVATARDRRDEHESLSFGMLMFIRLANPNLLMGIILAVGMVYLAQELAER